MMRYTVIGLGQFGQELCTELSARNIEVVAVASTDEELEQIKDLVTYAVVTDYTNPAALRELELDDQSAVIVAIGDSFEENLLVVTHLQKMGVRYIYARVMSPVHEHILSQMNVYALINLSRVASKQLASQLESPEFLRVSPMDENHSIVEIAVPRIWVGKRLRDVGLRTEHHLNLLTIRRGEAQTPQGRRNCPYRAFPSLALLHRISFLKTMTFWSCSARTNLIEFAQLSRDCKPSSASRLRVSLSISEKGDG
ncbi:MAG: potassium channel family protein [Akkermansia muciniphila]